MYKMIFVFCLSFLAISSHAAVTERTITVSGKCLRKVSPDRGTVTLVAEFTEKTSALASKKAMETYEGLRKAIVKMNLKDVEMQTSEYNVQEVYDYENNKRVSRGMKASLGLQVSTSEISRLGDLIALSSKFEINRVENLSTYLSRELTKTSEEACLTDAVKNARDKAEKMGVAAQAKIGEVQLIEENPRSGEPSPMPMMDVAAEASSARSKSLAPGIESKPETVAVSILVRFALK